MSWNLLPFTDPNVQTCKFVMTGGKRTYHNKHHIAKCFEYLERMGVPYNIELELALWWHDTVYDDQPNKEKRSAELWLAKGVLPSGASAGSIYRKIMLTEHHSVADVSDEFDVWMIKADLSGLAEPVETITNYAKIMDESIALYNVTPKEFARANINFLRELASRMGHNYQLTQDRFWIDVMDGIHQSISMSRYMLEGRT